MSELILKGTELFMEKNRKCRQASYKRKYRKNAVPDPWDSACFCRS